MKYDKKRLRMKSGYSVLPSLGKGFEVKLDAITLTTEKFEEEVKRTKGVVETMAEKMDALKGTLSVLEPPPKPKTVLRPNEDDMKMIDRFMSDVTVTEQLFDLVDCKMLDDIAPYDNDHDYIKKWYRDEVPNINSRGFARFIVSSKELARFVANNYDLVIELIESNTAYADPEHNSIILPAEAFDISQYENSVFSTGGEMAIRRGMASIANGMLVHEAAHFAKSPKTLLEGLRLGRLRMAARGEEPPDDGPVANLFLNMVEDFYIEDWLADEFIAYRPFIATVHEFYFCSNELKRRIMSCVYPAVDPATKAKFNGGAVLDLLIASKNWRYADDKFWGPKLTKYMELLRSARKEEDKAIRGEIALKLTRMFREDEDFTKDYWTGGSGLSILLDKDGIGIMAKFKPGTPGDEKDKIVLTRIGSIKREIEDDKAHEKRKSGSEFSHVRPIILKNPPYSGVDFALDPRFESLGQRLRKSLANNYVPGPAMKRGPVMVNTRLTRIVTDGKIFSYREKRKAEGKDYEFVILVDCSGSMHSSDKIKEAMVAGYTAYTSLRYARCRAVLFGHSDEGYATPVLYTIGDSNDPFHEVKSKAAAFLDRGGRGLLRNNYDGFAIKKAAEIGFSIKPSKKFMFVISDGQPAADGYNGAEAEAHTRRCVEEARHRGIDVISITIEHGAVRVNNEIYGRDKNVATTSPLVLNELISAMLTRTIR